MVGNVNIIVAASENRVIGREGRLPWSISEDWQYFLDQTRGGTLLLGRVCFEELQDAGVAGPERDMVVVTRRRDFAGGHVHTAGSIDEGLAVARTLRQPIWIAGGVSIYQATLELADRLYLTQIHAEIEGDRFFPEWRKRFTKVLSERQSEGDGYRYSFQVLAPGEWRLRQ